MPKEDMDSVFQASMVVKVLGRFRDDAEAGDILSSMSLENLGRSMEDGDLIGGSALVSVETLDSGQVAHRLCEIGNDGTFFDLCPDEDADIGEEIGKPRVCASGRILRAQMSQGWSNERLEALGREFIASCGLSDAFATFLEGRAHDESATGMAV